MSIKLSDPVDTIPYITEKYMPKLAHLGIVNVQDLLTYFPRAYLDTSAVTPLNNIEANDQHYTIKVQVTNFNSIRIRGGRSLQKAKGVDDSGEINLSWFNQVYLKNVFRKDGEEYLLYGKAKLRGNKIEFYPQTFEKVSESQKHLGRIVPEYALTSGVTKKWFRSRMKYLTDAVKNQEILIPESAFVPSIHTYLREVHFPTNQNTLDVAVEALGTLELANVHLFFKNKKKAGKRAKPVTIAIEKISSKVAKLIKKLPFDLTKDQEKIVRELLEKLHNGELLNELVQGDVGTGKTIIAILIAYAFALGGKQSVVLAPTTILAKQHFENFTEILASENVDIVLATSETNTNNISKPAIVIGTTAVLVRKDDLISNLGLVIVDEQHRFGVQQREELLKKLPFTNAAVHFINMTATPIPRSIAETFFADVSVRDIKTKPKGRKPVKTFLVPEKKREDSYKWIAKQIEEENEQVYWILPLVEESEAIKAKDVENHAKEIAAKIPHAKIQTLHGRMKGTEKIEIMKQFKKGEFDILVSTTVVEVGVDNPNANVLVIENAERYGLAQLHQIRGRVGRSDKQAYCFLFADTKDRPDAEKRLSFFARENDGLEIALYDLKRRGPGEVYGTVQSGVPSIKLGRIGDPEQIEKSKALAEQLFKQGIKKIPLFRDLESSI